MITSKIASTKKLKLSGRAVNLLLIALFAVGLGLILYPTVSDWWNQRHQSRAIESYQEAVEAMTAEEMAAYLDEARAYNEALATRSFSLTLSEEELLEYQGVLDPFGTGMMGYVEIPKISCYLAIYHGTDDSVLARNIGHLEGTSLPVGGESTHSVLSGHRGLTSARLFTDLDQLVEGDLFMIHVLNETFTYQVDQILTVLPEELSALTIQEGQDLCTLVTCTPYGVNSHRLLVRGHRVDNTTQVIVTGDALHVSSNVVAPLVAVPVLIVLLVVMLVTTRKKRRT